MPARTLRLPATQLRDLLMALLLLVTPPLTQCRTTVTSLRLKTMSRTTPPQTSQIVYHPQVRPCPVRFSNIAWRTEELITSTRMENQEYLYPNDERENDRLDLQHNLYLLTLDYKLGLAPPNDEGSGVRRVLDVGTGTGLWAIEFAEEHPEAEVRFSIVLGVDLSPPQAELFEIDDVEQPWTYSRPFDYIHIRGMTSSVSDWHAFFTQAYKGLTPGGYIELFEGHARTQSDDGTLTPDHAFWQCSDKLYECCKILGRPFAHVPDLVPILSEVGFVDVKIVPYKWPVGPWAKDPHYKELGEWALANAFAGLEAWTMAAFTRALDWTSAEVQVFLMEVRKDLRNRNIHHYTPMWVIYARKPEDEGQEEVSTA
ncbi:hypothetical protein CTA2_6647 [Colletotrichum tanaceti]|nr:hypothetical protein CTA2_6647 [Colletotrichum tanaceti]